MKTAKWDMAEVLDTKEDIIASFETVIKLLDILGLRLKVEQKVSA